MLPGHDGWNAGRACRQTMAGWPGDLCAMGRDPRPPLLGICGGAGRWSELLKK